MKRFLRRAAFCSLLTACVSVQAAADSSPATLIARPDGGWQTRGLPYEATFAANGALQSLAIDGFNFLSTPASAHGGLFLANGDTVSLFVSAVATGDTLKVQTTNAWLLLRFLPSGINVTLKNLGIADGHCGRLALGTNLARIKNPDTSEEHLLPARSAAGRLRLIAHTGASLTVPGQYLNLAGSNYAIRLPWAMPRGTELTFLLEAAPRPLLDDAIQVTARCPYPDFAYPAGDPQSFLTDFTNMADAPIRASVTLRLRPYLHKDRAIEMTQKLTLARNAARTLSWTLKDLDPSVYTAEVWIADKADRRLCASPRFIFNTSAMLPPSPPEDFDAFWERTLEEQARIPLDLQITKVKDQGRSEVFKFSFAGLLGHRAFGYLTVPLDKSKTHPAVLLLPSAGVHTLQPPSFPNDDRVGMAINIAWVDVDLPQDQYDWRTWPAPYLVTGILDPEYYSLRFSYAACVRAAEVLAARPEVNPDNILVSGSSQGGGLTLVTAGLYPKFKAAVANVPALCRLDWMLDLQPPYFPIAVNADSRPIIAGTLRYFDATHFARRIRCPIWISVGLLDDVTPPMGVFGAFNVIPAQQKQLKVHPFTGHAGGWDWHTAPEGVWP